MIKLLALVDEDPHTPDTTPGILNGLRTLPSMEVNTDTMKSWPTLQYIARKMTLLETPLMVLGFCRCLPTTGRLG